MVKKVKLKKFATCIIPFFHHTSFCTRNDQNFKIDGQRALHDTDIYG